MIRSDGYFITIDGVNVLPGTWRNFSGDPTAFRKEGGVRFFNIGLDDDDAKALEAQGFYVKHSYDKNDPDAPVRHSMKINVSYKRTAPTIEIVAGGEGNTIDQRIMTGAARRPLGEDDIRMLDSSYIKIANICFVPSRWAFNGNEGVSAYLNSLYVVLEENPYEARWQELQRRMAE